MRTKPICATISASLLRKRNEDYNGIAKVYDEASGVFEDADCKSGMQPEIYFQNVMFVIFKIRGFFTEAERSTARGRIDVVIKTSDYIYIIERNGRRRRK